MNQLCQSLHKEFAKVKAAQEDSSRALEKYLKDGSDPENLQVIISNLKDATKSYETYCKGAQKIPDGRAIWLPDYILNSRQLSSREGIWT